MTREWFKSNAPKNSGWLTPLSEQLAEINFARQITGGTEVKTKSQTTKLLERGYKTNR
jgi:hypothetical protein